MNDIGNVRREGVVSADRSAGQLLYHFPFIGPAAKSFKKICICYAKAFSILVKLNKEYSMKEKKTKFVLYLLQTYSTYKFG